MISNVKLKSLCEEKTLFVYKVESGETVFSLADKFHTTVEVIVKNNALTEDVKKGQFVIIERLDGEEYYVKPKDSVLKIANGNDEKKLQIIAKNKIEYLYVGQKLYI